MPGFWLKIACAVALAATAITAAGPVSAASSSTCYGGYSYAGLLTDYSASGLAVTIAVQAAPQVAAGHVDAYVNAGTAKAWLQVGVNTAGAGSLQQNYYYEYMRPGEAAPTYVPIKSSMAIGELHRLAIVQMPGSKDTWSVIFDGRVANPPFYLAGSHKNWHFSVSAESYLPSDGQCNQFSYLIAGVRLRSATGNWLRSKALLNPAVDPGNHLSVTGRDSWLASGHD